MNYRQIVISTLLLLTVASLTDKQILQQYLDGAFVQNNLPKSTTIIECLDDQSAKKMVTDIGNDYIKSAKGSFTDLWTMYNLTWVYLDNFPQQVQDCITDNKEIELLMNSYNITYPIDKNMIDKAFISYAALHYLAYHKQLGILNDMWVARNYYDCGFEAAKYHHSMFKAYNQLAEKMRQLEEFFKLSKWQNIIEYKVRNIRMQIQNIE